MSKEYYNNIEKFNTKAKGRKLFSMFEIYCITVKALRTISILGKAQKNGMISPKLKERIMLAVTSVNGCAMCSYAHSEMALRAGLSKKEIKSFVSGEFPDIPEEEVKAILFAQHYADKRGHIKKETWDELVKEYGLEKAKSILSVIRAIMMGNALGIAPSSIRSRLKGEKGDKRSSILYEFSFLILITPMTVLAIIQAIVENILNMPFIRFRE